jgi:hypothetical protein
MGSSKKYPVLAVFAAAVALCGVLAPDAQAEVALWLDPGNQELRSVGVLHGVVDDPEPIGSIWLRHHPHQPGLVVLNEGGEANGDGPPSLVVDFATSTVVVAWAKSNAGLYDVVVSRFDGTGWTSPMTVASASADELDPQVTLDPADGTVHLVYWIDDGNPRVLHRSAPAGTTSFGAAQQVSLPGEIALRPSATFHDGELRVAYEVHDYGAGQTPRQISVATLDEQGAFGHEGLTVTQHGEPNWVRIHNERGQLWLDWIDAEGEMGWIRQEGSGWSPVATEAFETAEEREFHVRGAIRRLAID